MCWSFVFAVHTLHVLYSTTAEECRLAPSLGFQDQKDGDCLEINCQPERRQITCHCTVCCHVQALIPLPYVTAKPFEEVSDGIVSVLPLLFIVRVGNPRLFVPQGNRASKHV